MAGSPERSKKTLENARELRGQILEWYAKHARELPWRAVSGQVPDPYHVWLSEIMLQQTTVQAVKPYYTKFLQKWPKVEDLAAADTEEVMAAWAGLGYYARARNLHKCADVVASDLGGVFPSDQAALKKLPGIGDYTSAAIAAIAFNQPATVVDGNIERVMARLFDIHEPLPASKKTLKEHADLFFDGFTDAPGDLAQAMMDLGAGVCIPKAPRCALCPLRDGCLAHERGSAADLPKKAKKKPRPQKYGLVHWVVNERGEVLFHKRPDKGLLAGMVGLPTSEWKTEIDLAYDGLPFIDHVFTHFDLRLYIQKSEQHTFDGDYFWGDPNLKKDKMPSLFQKVCAAMH